MSDARARFRVRAVQEFIVPRSLREAYVLNIGGNMLKPVIIAAVLSGVIISSGALAGEVIKFKSHHNNVGTKWESSELGDEPGHIRGIFEAKGVGIRYAGPSEPPYKIDCWGSGEYWKDGTASEMGFCKFTFLRRGLLLRDVERQSGQRPRSRNRCLLRRQRALQGDEGGQQVGSQADGGPSRR